MLEHKDRLINIIVKYKWTVRPYRLIIIIIIVIIIIIITTTTTFNMYFSRIF
jgi:uncharacterized integral membrane protein